MYKKIVMILLAFCFMMVLVACGERKSLHCDECGKEVTVAKDSNMEENWLVFCDECGDIEQ